MYKAFQDFYKEANIKHLILEEYKGALLSPPFATEQCKEYSSVWSDSNYVNLDLPPVTSKINATAVVDDSVWFIPYGIYDEFNIVVQLKDNQAIYHKLPFTGKGQFYSVATNHGGEPNTTYGDTAFSFPLGYEETNNAIYIRDNEVTVHKLPHNGKKLHMGTVYCNGRYWSMPRGDEPGYTSLLSFNGSSFDSYELDIDPAITRKYTDIIVKGTTLYSLPFGEDPGLNTIVEFDTKTNTAQYHTINGVDFAKKYNCGVMLGDNIVAVPYGDELLPLNSNRGLVFNTVTKQSYQFDIGLEFGGKYRFRCGVEFNNHAYFFPSGTPSCPILVIDENGNIIKEKYFEDIMFGRPIIYNNQITIITYHMKTQDHFICVFDDKLNIIQESKL